MPRLFVEMEASSTVCPGWPQTAILLISISQVAEIIGMIRHAWLNRHFFNEEVHIANKYMKKFNSLANREIQIKLHWDFTLPQSEWLSEKKKTTTNDGKDSGRGQREEILLTADVNVN
jgi:hypothetical protein